MGYEDYSAGGMMTTEPIVLTDQKFMDVFDGILDQIIVRPKSLLGVRLNVNT